MIQTGADSDLWGLYEKALANRSAWGYSVRALPGGALKPGQRVKLSYDVAAGAVGWGDWSSTPQVRHKQLADVGAKKSQAESLGILISESAFLIALG